MTAPSATQTTTPTTGDNTDGAQEWGWIRAAQTGDRDAFGLVYLRYRSRVQAFLQVRVGAREIAEDLTSETFLRAWRRLDSVTEQRTDPGAWLLTIARNLAIDHLKSAQTRFVDVVAEIPEPRRDGGDGRSAETVALDRIERQRTTALVAAAISMLNPLHQDAAHAVLAGRSHAAEADRLHLTVGAVKTRRYRALAALRTRLCR